MIYGYDTLRPYIVNTDGHYDDDGNWTVSAGEWGDSIPCDVGGPGNEASTISYEGGKYVRYSYEITLEADVQRFVVGDKVQITIADGDPEEMTVKGFRRYRSHAKLWV